jgi:hypothetical protein
MILSCCSGIILQHRKIKWFDLIKIDGVQKIRCSMKVAITDILHYLPVMLMKFSLHLTMVVIVIDFRKKQA